MKDVSFQIKKGDVVGILGTNGSGKSTLSLILAGISDHDGGKMIVNGEQALISINTGLNMQLTGEENINVKGALMGFSKKRIQEIKENVIEFAELGEFPVSARKEIFKRYEITFGLFDLTGIESGHFYCR